MVYCTKCGTQNKDDAKYCTQCGSTLEVSREKSLEQRAEEWGEEFGRRAEEWGEDYGRRVEVECFGLPHGGVIAGLLFGIIVIIVGLSFVPGLIPPEVRMAVEPYFWPTIIIIVGVLVIAGALYRLRRRY
jgi:ribosomal protein L40E